ncbi:MAG: hypothetical protein LBL62_09190 [Planctomycetaceae bacterium]|nr:hypothetical protein [Planctomycetaceae bacterium]
MNWQANEILLDETKKQAEAENQFTYCREFSYQGQTAVQYAYETGVVLLRPARRNVKNKQVSVQGEPLTLRLVMAKLLEQETSDELGCWYLLANVPADVSPERIALWYYYCWKIETYFKLMKSVRARVGTLATRKCFGNSQTFACRVDGCGSGLAFAT